jgi:hypothetical protein
MRFLVMIGGSTMAKAAAGDIRGVTHPTPPRSAASGFCSLAVMRVLTHARTPCGLQDQCGRGGNMKYIHENLDDIEELFDQADEDRDDQISLTEFRGLMLTLDRKMHDDEVASHFLKIDANRDGRIGFAEFRNWLLRD